MTDTEVYLEKLPFYGVLSENDRQIIRRSAFIKKFAKNEPIVSLHDACMGLMYIVSGEIRASVISENGREVTLFNLKDGEVCVFSASCVISEITLETEITSRKNTEILVISANAVKSVMSANTGFRCFVYELAVKRFSTAMWVLQEIIFSGFDKRLASYLCSYCDENGTNSVDRTQDEIAVDVGSSREVVTRMLKHFSNDGIISVKRGSILVKNRAELDKIAEGK